MPSEKTHLDQGRHNENCFDNLDHDIFGDWAVTVLFYAALHYVDAYLAQMKEHPRRHGLRDTAIQKYGKTKSVRPFYRRLQDRSSDARYDAAKITAAEVKTLKTDNFDPLKKILTT